jgi:DnaJ-class molecular chaperone
MHTKKITKADVGYLRAMRITPDDICALCDGYGRINDHKLTCRDCNGTGRIPTTLHAAGCQGDGCECGACGDDPA